MICFKNVDFSYGNKKIFQNLSIQLEENNRYCILGENGVGKSTFLNLLLGLEKPERGIIEIDGRNITESLDSIRREIGVVFQNPNEQILGSRVEEELAFNMENYNFLWEKMNKIVDKIVKTFNLKDRKKRIEELSGGEKQKLSIASSKVMEPKIFIYDEITSMLNKENRDRILKEISREKKGIIIMVSHYLEEIKYFDKIIYFSKNKEVFVGDKKKFLEKIFQEEMSVELTPLLKIAKKVYSKKKEIINEVFDLERVCEEYCQLF